MPSGYEAVVATWYLDPAQALLSRIARTPYHSPNEDHTLTIQETFVMDDGGTIIIRRAPDAFGPEGEGTRCWR